MSPPAGSGSEHKLATAGSPTGRPKQLRPDKHSAKSRHSIRGRLHSIVHDAAFVEGVARRSGGLPLVANERSGSWYVPPWAKAASVYFKSTDGHVGEWAFSLRRLNLNLLPFLAQHEGCIIVDCTGRHKLMPDALSKTIPIWICVWNRILFPDDPEACRLSLPSTVVVDEAERAEIESRLPRFVSGLRALDLDLTAIGAASVKRPLRPIWTTQRTSGLPVDSRRDDASCYPVVLCTASGRGAGGGEDDDDDDEDDVRDWDYVHGAADDAEFWAYGLDASGFWRNKDALLAAAAEDDLPDLIASLVSPAEQGPTVNGPRSIAKCPQLVVGRLQDLTDDLLFPGRFDAVVACGPGLTPRETCPGRRRQGVVRWEKHVRCARRKAGPGSFRDSLPAIVAGFVARVLARRPDATMLIACPTGTDQSIGVALAILCRFLAAEEGDGGEVRLSPSVECGRSSAAAMDKDEIKKRLSWITASIPEASPSRATMQAVNVLVCSVE